MWRGRELDPGLSSSPDYFNRAILDPKLLVKNTVGRITHQQESGEELTPSYKKDEVD